jgi:Uma2 family endonuclease
MASSKTAFDEDVSDIKPHPGRRMTEKEFVEWCDSNTRAEWVDGEVVTMVPVGDRHDDEFVFLVAVFRGFVDEKEVGRVSTEPRQIRLGTQRRRRSPDIFFIAESRRHIIQPGHVEGAPDLIVEIVSPDEPARDWREKYFEYEAAGVREYWIIDPNSNKVEVYTLDRTKKYRVIPERDGAIHSKVLKGFFLKPEWLWREKLPKVLAVLREMGVR